MNKIKLNNFLNFLGVVVIGISLPISIYVLKTGNLDLRISAFQSDEPNNISISNITADSFKVSWTTEKKVYGAVKLLNEGQPLTDTNETSFHSLAITKLERGRNYQFQILSGNNTFEKIYSTQTHAINFDQPSSWLYGQVFSKDGISVLNGGLISLTISKDGVFSQNLTTTINETGGYQFNLAGITDLNEQSFPFKQNVDIELTIYPNSVDKPVVRKFTLDLNFEKQIPNTYLGDIDLQVIPGVSAN